MNCEAVFLLKTNNIKFQNVGNVAKSVDSGQMPHFVVFDLRLDYLLWPIFPCI